MKTRTAAQKSSSFNQSGIDLETVKSISLMLRVGNSNVIDTHAAQQVFGERQRPVHPEFNLMLTVLEDAFDVLTKGNPGRSSDHQRVFNETVEWLNGSSTWTFSFEAICEAFNFDVDYLRRGILAQVKHE